MNRFLKGTQKYTTDSNNEFGGACALADHICFVVSANSTPFVAPATLPFPSFASPFIGQGAEEISSWFKSNLMTSLGNNDAFIMLDEQTVQDRHTCLLVVFENQWEPIQKLRCDFYSPHREAADREWQAAPWDSFGYATFRGYFIRSQLVLTREARQLVFNGPYLDFLPTVNGVYEMQESTDVDHSRPRALIEVGDKGSEDDIIDFSSEESESEDEEDSDDNSVSESESEEN